MTFWHFGRNENFGRKLMKMKILVGVNQFSILKNSNFEKM